MAGNSRRQGAMRKPGSKKGQQVGSGGQKAKGLRGKGPTPKAAERTKHVAARRAKGSPKGADTARTPAPRRRSSGGPEYVVGRNAVLEALQGGVPATALYVASRIDSDDRVRDALQVAADRGVALLEAPRTELDRLVGRLPHQGVVLQVPEYVYAHPDDLLARAAAAGETPLVVVLDHVTDPRNLGAVVRSAAAFGAHGVVVPDRRAAGMTASAWKTSAGAAARVPVARVTNVARVLQSFQQQGCFVVGLAGDGDTDIAALPTADAPMVLVVGAEGTGLSRLVRESCDLVARIPIAATTESLNAGVAAGIALYAVTQQR